MFMRIRPTILALEAGLVLLTWAIIKSGVPELYPLAGGAIMGLITWGKELIVKEKDDNGSD